MTSKKLAIDSAKSSMSAISLNYVDSRGHAGSTIARSAKKKSILKGRQPNVQEANFRQSLHYNPKRGSDLVEEVFS